MIDPKLPEAPDPSDSAAEPDGPDPGTTDVLVAEDDPLMRDFLAAILGSLGYTVTEAEDGLEALEILERTSINLVITDWMMPNVDGPELCRRVRARRAGGYTYLILLTGRQDSSALVEGMEAGADDFLTKPPDINELRVRLKAGQRVLSLERQLERRNRTLASANRRLGEAYRRIERDLEAAATAQRRLLPKPREVRGLRYDWLFLPSSHIGGDTFNVVRGGPATTVFYQIDVAGHGVPAALMSFSLQHILSDAGPETGVSDPRRGGAWRDPVAVVAELNRRFQAEGEDAGYFTMVYGVLDEDSGEVVLTQAGHPPPLHVRRDGSVVAVGEGGPVVGLLPDVEYEPVALRLRPGDRLVLYTDGVVECADARDELFSEERLAAAAAETLGMPLDQAVRELGARLEAWRGAPAYDDDVSVLVIERTGEGG